MRKPPAMMATARVPAPPLLAQLGCRAAGTSSAAASAEATRRPSITWNLWLCCSHEANHAGFISQKEML
jgi:hypothetical protein